MFWQSLNTLLIYIALMALITPLLGYYMAFIFADKKSPVQTSLGWLENLCYRTAGVDATHQMPWRDYLESLLWFNFFGFVVLFLMLVTQDLLPLNPQHYPGLSLPLAFNTSISFVTNTNWQSYAGETTLSYFSQMVGLTVQNFVSAATGFAVLLALIRSLTSHSKETIGNFWVDLVRCIVYVLLPLSLILAIILISQGVIQNFNSYLEITTLEGLKQTIPGGPAASQIAIKQIGTNGGGFFNTNSAHPFENPSSFSNWLEMIALVAIPVASTYTYGILTKDKKHAWLLFIAMFVIWLVGMAVSWYAQHLPNQIFDAFPLLEGIETRFGTTNSLIWSTSTTATSNGSVNAMMSSLSPLVGGVALFNMMLGELAFGGVGVGLCSIVMFAILTVFLSGLMVGRTPEYMGKKIEKKEIKWVIVAILVPGSLILVGTALSLMYEDALKSLSHTGPHGFTEVLYAFTSAAGNNGSSFAGLNADTIYYNLSLGVVMVAARLAIIVPTLAIAGLLARKTPAPATIGTFSISSPLFLILLLAVIVIVGALTFFPALALGPIVEHILMLEGRFF